MTSHEIRTGIVAPTEVLGSPNHVWSVSSQVLAEVLNGNQASLLKIEDGLPRFLLLFCFVFRNSSLFPSIICGHFSMLELYSRRVFFFFLALENALNILEF